MPLRKRRALRDLLQAHPCRYPHGSLESLLDHAGDDGAEKDKEDRRENEHHEGEEHFHGGFVRESLGAFKASLAHLIGLDAQNGTYTYSQLVGLNQGIYDGSEFLEVDA